MDIAPGLGLRSFPELNTPHVEFRNTLAHCSCVICRAQRIARE